MKSIALKYLPKQLTAKDKRLQKRMLLKSRRLYKQGRYYTRKRIQSYPTKESPHIQKARRLYGIETLVPSKALATATGCSLKAQKAIVRKGEGAYFSSGSRPSQTGQSWGYARLASALTGGKAAAVDYAILEEGCAPTGTAMRLARQAKQKHGKGTRRVAKATA
jgi:hypothetical protein